MKKLVVLGPGCKKCETLYAHVKQAADELGIDYELEKVSEIAKMMPYGMVITPALAVDGVVKISGKAASVDEIKTALD